jgi:hypothetical protein
MRNLILGLSLSVAFIVGCLAGPVVQPTLAPSLRAAPGTVKWEYHCVGFRQASGNEIARELNKAGALGWELAVTDRVNWCLKRRVR